VDALLGYLAGVPTYILTAELASCRLLRGDIPATSESSEAAAARPDVDSIAAIRDVVWSALQRRPGIRVLGDPRAV
jgi:hypothetical protein